MSSIYQNLLSLTCFIGHLTLAQSSTKPHPLQLMWSDLPDGTPIECHLYSWPTDDRLCDTYEESAGERSLRVYQTVEGKILLCEDFGAYCQGDSEYGTRSFFNTEGQLILREEGFNPYVDQRYTLFENGKFVSQHIAPPEYGVYNVIEIDSSSLSFQTSKYIKILISDFRVQLNKRYQALLKMFPSLSEEDQSEAEMLIRDIERTLRDVPLISNFVLRNANEREADQNDLVFIAGKHQKIYHEPSLSSEILNEISYFNGSVPILEIGQKVTLDNTSIDHWIKVNFWHSGLDEPIEGWVLSSGLMRGFFPE